MRSLHALPTFTDDRDVRVVVESPRGARVKLTYDPKLGVFEWGRELALGVSYPYDWGFVPGTRAEDGDPLDALVISDAPSWPGVVLPVRPLGVVAVTEPRREPDLRRRNGDRIRNDRVIAVPSKQARYESLTTLASLSARMRLELEQFFCTATFFDKPDVRVVGWRGPEAAQALIAKARRAFRAR